MQPEELSTTLKRSDRGSQKRRRKNVQSQLYERNFFWATDSFLSGSSLLFRVKCKMFQRANEALNTSLKDLARQGLISSTKHKRPIANEDLEALSATKQLGLDIPASLINTFGSLLWQKRPWKSTRDKADWLTAQNNDCWAKVLRPEWWYQQPRRWNSLIMVWPGNSRCLVACLEKYLAKR